MWRVAYAIKKGEPRLRVILKKSKLEIRMKCVGTIRVGLLSVVVLLFCSFFVL